MSYVQCKKSQLECVTWTNNNSRVTKSLGVSSGVAAGWNGELVIGRLPRCGGVDM